MMRREEQQNNSTLRSPYIQQNTKTPMSSKFKLTLQKTPMMSIEEKCQSTNLSMKMECEIRSPYEDGLKSRKLLNFLTTPREQINDNLNCNIGYSNERVNLRDVLGDGNF